jgi:hypothetical protein
MSKQVGYARISTGDQTTRQQHDELKAAGCEAIVEDVISGKSTEREGLDRWLAAMQPGDTFVVVALGRSTSHVIATVEATVEALGKRGVGFRSLREPMFDTTSPTGEFMLTIFAGLAQLERRMIRAYQVVAECQEASGRNARASDLVDAFAVSRSTGEGRGGEGSVLRRAVVCVQPRDPLSRDEAISVTVRSVVRHAVWCRAAGWCCSWIASWV